jgi:arabinofuranosyltransferase
MLVVTGGDALSGRSLVPAFACAVVLLSRFRWEQFGNLIVVPAALVVGLGMTAPGSPILADADFGKSVLQWNRWPGDPAPRPTEMNRIRDERRLSYQSTGLLKGQRYVPLPDTSGAEVGVNAALAAGRHVIMEERVGLVGAVAGPRLYVIDSFGRGDPFLARRARDGAWHPGGVARKAPDGYVESLEANQDLIRDPAIAREYDEIALVTRGALFSRERIRAILDLNLRLLQYVVSAFRRTATEGPAKAGHDVRWHYSVVRSKPFAATGSRRIRVPVVAKIAFVSAGATHGYGISPRPVGARSLSTT